MARSTDTLMLQGHPIRVEWAGWESDTYTLSRQGWSIATHESYADNAMHLVLHHKGMDVTGTGRMPHYRDMLFSRMYDQGFHSRDMDGFVVSIQNLTSSQRIMLSGDHPIAAARWVDPMPELRRIETRPLKDLSLFRQLDMPAGEELITEPDTVQELLDKILSMQGPMRKEIRAREARRDREAPVPRRIHAQIVSLAA